MNFELLIQEWVNLKAEQEFAKNRLISNAKRLKAIEEEIQEYENTIKQIVEALNTIEYLIFYHRFILQKKIWEIAQDTKYSESHIKRIIKNIKKKINDTKMKL